MGEIGSRTRSRPPAPQETPPTGTHNGVVDELLLLVKGIEGVEQGPHGDVLIEVEHRGGQHVWRLVHVIDLPQQVHGGQEGNARASLGIGRSKVPLDSVSPHTQHPTNKKPVSLLVPPPPSSYNKKLNYQND